MRLTVLDPQNPEQKFPEPGQALSVPDGLLAIGGCLSTNRLLNAYRQGIFPWNSVDEPILWWSPDPRMVLFPDKLTISHSLAKTLRQAKFTITTDRAFTEVMLACAQPRKDDKGTWITAEILQAYHQLHLAGYAHSAEAWLDGKLVGGLYGVAIGRVFYGESMFFRQKDASKAAFVTLVQRLEKWGYKLIDCQISTPHLKSLGAGEISRNEFSGLLRQYCDQAPEPSSWREP